MTASHLLPPNASALEIALATPLARLNTVPVPIDRLLRADQCPAALLPWLAWALSVDIWDARWTEEKKRAICAESFELHRRKGTVYTLKRYLAYAGASLSEAERTAWLARFPQIRIFNFQERGTRSFGAFTRGAWTLPKTFLAPGIVFPYQTGAGARVGRRAVLWNKGSHYLATGLEVPLMRLDRVRGSETGVATAYEQILIPGTGVKGLFLGAMARGNAGRRRFALESAAGARVVSIAIQTPYSTQTDMLAPRTIVPSLTPVEAFPEKVAERGMPTRGIQIFGGMAGRWLDPETRERKPVKGYLLGFLPETTAPLRLYDRLYLHDPARVPDRADKASSFCGAMRLGMPAFNAQLDLVITGKRAVRQADRFVWGHLYASPQTPLLVACQAVDRAKSARDRILINTKIRHKLTTRDRARSSVGYRSNAII